MDKIMNLRPATRPQVNQIADQVPSKPQPVGAQEVRPSTLPDIQAKKGTTLVCDYYDNKFGRA